jgi:hypothetical protein
VKTSPAGTGVALAQLHPIAEDRLDLAQLLGVEADRQAEFAHAAGRAVRLQVADGNDRSTRAVALPGRSEPLGWDAAGIGFAGKVMGMAKQRVDAD